MQHIVKTNLSDQEREQIYHLRWRMLRAPWNQAIGTEQDELEDSAINVGIFDSENQAVATGRIHQVDENTMQIRYMAVDTRHQGFGLGNKVLSALENEALKRNTKKIILHSRNIACDFYHRNGYELIGKSHLLYEDIQHYLMEKQLA